MSGWEFLIILFVCLLVVGPRKLPLLAKRCGNYLRYGKNLIRDLEAQARHGDLQQPPQGHEPTHESNTEPK